MEIIRKKPIKTKNYISCIAISSDGKYIVSASNKFIDIWELETGKLLRTLEGHKSSVESVAISPDGKYIASGSNDKSYRVWEL